MEKMNKKDKFGAILILLIIIISCRNSADWYPAGQVSISSFSEDTDASGDKYCTIFYCIENTGKSKISQSTISFQIITDKNQYYVTKVNTVSILPNGKIWDSFAVTYFDPTEVSAQDKISVKDSFFE